MREEGRKGIRRLKNEEVKISFIVYKEPTFKMALLSPAATVSPLGEKAHT